MENLLEQIAPWALDVQRYLLRWLGSRVLAEDLAHEAAARLLERVREGQAPREPRGWLFRTARNLALDEVRRRLPSPLGLEALGLVADPQSLHYGESGWLLGDQVVTRQEMLTLLPEAMGRLPLRDRLLLHAHYREGLDCRSVAHRERISLANAKVRLHRARLRLRQLLVESALHREPGAKE